VVTHRYYFELEFVLTAVEEFNVDIIVFEESRTMKDIKSLVRLIRELKKRGKVFIFVTHISKKISRFWHKDPNIPLYSRYRKAIPYFDATAIIDRDIFNDNDTEKIRLFEKRKRKYQSIPIHFDFLKQKVTYK
jgi:methionine synthase II (cobalamin-independent)